MSQPQPSVREKAREMFEKAIGKDKVVPIQPVQYVGRQLGYNEAKTEIREKLPEVIDQIITLAQEEKEKEISSIIQEEFYRVSVEDSSMRTKEWTAYRDMVVKLNKILKQ